MSKQTLLALIVWAMSRDMLSLPFTRVVELFKKDAQMSKLTVEQFSDYVIADAEIDIRKFGYSYGKLNNNILNYKRL